MGGTRLAHAGEAMRIGRREHDRIAETVARALAPMGIHAVSPPAIRTKADFGDVDLVTRVGQTSRFDDAEIAAALDAVAYDRGQLRNPTMSALIRSMSGLVQIDLTSLEDDVHDFAFQQLSWGDAGSLASITARQAGLKIGMHGIALSVGDATARIRARIDVPYARALELIGLDPDVHARGFDTNEDVYRWISTGDLFDPRVYQPGHLTNAARHRAGKRPAYTRFLTWMHETGVQARYDWGARGERLDEWTARLGAMFPETMDDVHRQQNARSVRTGTRAFFTGEAVERATGVTGHRLDHLMATIRTTIGADRIREMGEAQDHEGLAREARRLAATDYLPDNFTETRAAVCRRRMSDL